MNEHKMCRPVIFSGLVFWFLIFFPSISCIWHIIINLDVDV